MKTYQSFSSAETAKLGEKFAKQLKRVARRKHAAVIALRGELGAGKTTFTQGFLKGFGFKKRAQSPTFVVMRRHTVHKPHRGHNIFHVDAYRLKKAGDLAILGFKEIIKDPRHTILIEWPERVGGIVPKGATTIVFKHGKRENERRITIKK